MSITEASFLNADRPTGAQASAKASFLAGTQAPALEDELHGMPTADAAQTAVTEFAAAVKTCKSLAMGDPTLSMTVKVSALPAPALGEKAMAFQMKITSGPVAGTTMTGIRVSTGRVVTNVTASSPSANTKQATAAARTTTARVQSTLGVPPNSPVAQQFHLRPSGTRVVALLDFGSLTTRQQSRIRASVARLAPAAQTADGTLRTYHDTSRSVAGAVALTGSCGALGQAATPIPVSEAEQARPGVTTHSRGICSVYA